MKSILNIKKISYDTITEEFKKLAKTNPKVKSLHISNLEKEDEQHKLGFISRRMKSVFQITIFSILFKSKATFVQESMNLSSFL